ncbi:Mg2+ transporter protein CorA-like/Zinc transport protein [Lasiodiplodia theobromae]|uniref:Mg2+ transporter protein CorA-like/Zinc transport protein n=1 Tax=Lasiodiplodia theobromae TaxID=45133 RepID=UPI0015C30BB0|nr:Mg2+ transporter protein CorA-like/Zinc transport protein [Lasiodiplodia theobromae]KAF4546674.1 Mg2+ transporter protein CorA-like/Zinc transport protein [Lasiodiplodia theobromae]
MDGNARIAVCSDSETPSQGSPTSENVGTVERREGLQGLIAEQLEAKDNPFSELDVDYRFLRLAIHHARKDSNGLFGCRTVHKAGQGPLKHDSWCCFKIKQVQRDESSEKSDQEVAYKWQQPSINISWNTQDHITLILCMDVPNELRWAIKEAWDNGRIDGSDPYNWHCFIVEKISDIYDEAIWSLRNFVRLDVEKRRIPDSIDFERLHEIARHIIHSNETLEVAFSTLEGMQEAHQAFSEEVFGKSKSSKVFSARHTQLEISGLKRTIRASFLRSKSLSDRIHNEINLAYNLVNQRDGFLMKTIAVMTLVYVPGSYIATIFGMNFFDYSETEGLVLSHMFWLYWVLVVILTAITVGTWLIWQRRGKHVRKKAAPKENGRTSSFAPSFASWDFGKVRKRKSSAAMTAV